MDRINPNNGKDCLVWMPELGMGYHTGEPMSYENDYWSKYVDMDNTAMGEELTRVRCKFVKHHYNGQVVDIGIGAGRFVKESGAKGYDVNVDAINWLRERNLYQDPYKDKVYAITCWDSLEHIPEPEKLINQVKEWVFVSMPIYTSGDDVLQSKHYRPNEHLWYWTREGLVKWFNRLGFNLVTSDDFETKIGREQIETFAFKRYG